MDYVELRRLIKAIVVAKSVTHRTLYEYCESMGLNTAFQPEGNSKAERLAEVVDKTPDESLCQVGHTLLAYEQLSADRRNALQDLLWPPCKEISKRCRREIAESLSIDDLFRDSGAFDNLLINLFVMQRSSDIFAFGQGADLDLIDRHVHRNPGDWSVEDLWKYVGAIDCSDRRFAMFMEGLAHGDVQLSVERQRHFVERVNERLKPEGLELREVGTDSGYPEFRVVNQLDHALGKPKNLIFASSEKPDIRFRDAVNNDIELVSNADKVLVYDRTISQHGLTWQDLQDWWRESAGLRSDEEAKISLYKRLRSCLPKESPPQVAFFTTYFRTFQERVPTLPALLPEVWLHWDSKTVKERGTKALLRSRMDFLLLLPADIRVVIEIDGQHHYADGEKANARKYSEMVAADRALKLDGYQVYRFGGYELTQSNSSELISTFLVRLFRRFSVI